MIKFKNWKIFTDAVSRLKIENGEFVKCEENDKLIDLMNESGITPEDIDKLLNKRESE